jgi:hypothetical protein
MQSDFRSHHKVVQALKADSYATGASTSAEIDTTGFAEAVVIFDAGTVGASATVDVIVRDCATTGGTYADLTGAVFTQVVAANDEAVYVGRIRLNSATAGTTDKCERFIKIQATVGTASCDLGVTVLLLNATGTGVTLNTMSFSID